MLRAWHNAYLWLVTNKQESHFPFSVSFPDPSILRPGSDSQNSLTAPPPPPRAVFMVIMTVTPLHVSWDKLDLNSAPFFLPPSIPTSSTSVGVPPQGTSNWAPGSMCSSNIVLPYRLIVFVIHSFLCQVLLKAFLSCWILYLSTRARHTV